MFGLGIWLPHLFIQFKEYEKLHPNSTVSVSQLSRMQNNTGSSHDNLFDRVVMINTIIIAAASMVYNIISCWASSKLKSAQISMISMLVGGASALSIYWMTSSFQNLVAASIFQSAMITANMAIAGVGVELFPTQVNGLAMCCIMFSGRLGAVFSNFLFGYYVDSHCEVPIFVVSIIVLLGGILCLFFRNKSTNKSCQQEKSF